MSNDIARLREALRKCRHKDECPPTCTGFGLVFPSLWETVSWCEAHGPVESAHRCRSFDDMRHNRKLVPKTFRHPLEAVGPILTDWLDIGESITLMGGDGEWHVLATNPREYGWQNYDFPDVLFEVLTKACRIKGWLKAGD